MATKHCAICEADFIWSDCVEGGRADLARKVLEIVKRQQIRKSPEESLTVLRAHNFAVNDTLTALRQLFAKEGIDLNG